MAIREDDDLTHCCGGMISPVERSLDANLICLIVDALLY